jgi:hypothetical protein
MSEVPKKRCTGPCDRLLPATPEFFHRHKGKPFDLTSMCKRCRSEAVQVYESQSARKEKKQTYNRNRYYHPVIHRQILAQKREYNRRPEVQLRDGARMKRYRNQPEVRQRLREKNKRYRQRPEIQARERFRRRIRDRQPERHDVLLVQKRNYNHRPTVQAQRSAWQKRYYAQPEVHVKRLRYSKAHQRNPANRMKYRAYYLRRRALKRTVLGTHTHQQIQELLNRHHYHCYYCGNELPQINGKYVYHIDHTFPLSRVAGTDIPANDISYLVPTCPTCNKKKGNRFPYEFPEGGKLL